jgi:hypothetical protein
MAVEVQVGVAKIFGLDGATMVTLTGAATITIDDADLVSDFAKHESTGQDGNVENAIAWGETDEVTINFQPKGATRAAAIVSLTNSKPAPLSKVVLSGFKAAQYNGDYNYLGGWNPKMTKEGIVVAGVKLKAYIANRASMTAGVIAG